MKWNEVVKVDIRGTRIAAKDAMVMLSEDESEPSLPFVDVQPGLFIAEINLASAWHCKRFRIRRDESNPEPGRTLGSIDVDCGKAAFIDYGAFSAMARDDFDSYESWTEMELDDELAINFSGQIDLGDAVLVYVKSGDGDGTYPVFELVDNGEVVGIECRFE